MDTRDKRAKFIELANKRVNRAIKDLRLVGNLANANNYAYTDDQVKKILNALKKELENVRKNFEGAGNRTDDFTL